jgi:hypothetical protein
MDLPPSVSIPMRERSPGVSIEFYGAAAPMQDILWSRGAKPDASPSGDQISRGLPANRQVAPTRKSGLQNHGHVWQKSGILRTRRERPWALLAGPGDRRLVLKHD